MAMDDWILHRYHDGQVDVLHSAGNHARFDTEEAALTHVMERLVWGDRMITICGSQRASQAP